MFSERSEVLGFLGFMDLENRWCLPLCLRCFCWFWIRLLVSLRVRDIMGLLRFHEISVSRILGPVEHCSGFGFGVQGLGFGIWGMGLKAYGLVDL